MKSLEAKVFSNLGIANGCYLSGGQRVEVLLGESSREVEVEHY